MTADEMRRLRRFADTSDIEPEEKDLFSSGLASGMRIIGGAFIKCLDTMEVDDES